MIRRYLAIWANGPALPMLAVGVAGGGSVVMGWALATVAWASAAGVPAVTAAAVALVPLWAAGTVLYGLIWPRPHVARAGSASVAIPPAAEALAPAPPEGSGAGGPVHTAARPAAAPIAAGRAAHQLPAAGRVTHTVRVSGAPPARPGQRGERPALQGRGHDPAAGIPLPARTRPTTPVPPPIRGRVRAGTSPPGARPTLRPGGRPASTRTPDAPPLLVGRGVGPPPAHQHHQ